MKIADIFAVVALGSLSALLIGCTGDPFATESEADAELVTPAFRIAVPATPTDRLAANGDGEPYLIADHADLRVTLDGVQLALDERDADGRAVVRWSRPPGSRVELRVEWAENIALDDGTVLVLPLATFERSLTIERSMAIEIGPDDYAVDGGANGERDQDGDGDGNLLERTMGFSPFNGSECPENCDPAVSLYIKRVDRRLTNRLEIDGEYDDEWNSAELDGRDGRLFIDTIGFSSEAGGGNGGPTRFTDSGATPFQFLAMHDDERLFLAVVGDGDDNRNTPWGDSANPANDDAVTLYVDTDEDPSRGAPTSTIVVPLMGLNTGEGDSSDRMTARAVRTDLGSASPYFPTDLRYATCVCDGARQFWELSIPLASLGIVRGQPFGFDVAVSDDSTGGDSVTQWVWQSMPNGAGDFADLGLVGVR